MARIVLPDVATMNEADRALYDRLSVNLIRGMLRSNDCAAGYMNLAFALLRNADLAPRHFELVILRVAALSNSAYERMHHVPPARQAGWTDADIAAIELGEGDKLDPFSADLLAFVDECVEKVRVSNHTFARLRARISESAIADVTLLIGFYMMTARFLETLDIDLDENWCEVRQLAKNAEMTAS
jgi:alkylhydroperoxidase family enzyme